MFHSYLQHTTHMIIFSRLQIVNQNITIHPCQTRLQTFNFILARLTNQRIVVIQIIADERNQSLNLFVLSHFPVLFHIERIEMKREHSAIHIDSGDIPAKPLPSRLFRARIGRSMCCRGGSVSHSQADWDWDTVRLQDRTHTQRTPLPARFSF